MSIPVLRTSSLSRTVIYLRMKERLARRRAKCRKDGPGSRRGRRTSLLTSWTPKFPRGFWVSLVFTCKQKPFRPSGLKGVLCLSHQPGSEEEEQGGARLQGDVGRAADHQRRGRGRRGRQRSEVARLACLFALSVMRHEVTLSVSIVLFAQITERLKIYWKKLESRV